MYTNRGQDIFVLSMLRLNTAFYSSTDLFYLEVHGRAQKGKRQKRTTYESVFSPEQNSPYLNFRNSKYNSQTKCSVRKIPHTTTYTKFMSFFQATILTMLGNYDSNVSLTQTCDIRFFFIFVCSFQHHS